MLFDPSRPRRVAFVQLRPKISFYIEENMDKAGQNSLGTKLRLTSNRNLMTNLAFLNSHLTQGRMTLL